MKKEFLEKEKWWREECSRCNHIRSKHNDRDGCTGYKGFWHWLIHNRVLYSCECERFEP